MKTILFAAALCIGIVRVNSQVIESYPITVKGNFFANNNKRFSNEKYFVECETSQNRVTYFVYNLEKKSLTTIKCQPILKGVPGSSVIRYYVIDDHIYELALGSKVGKSKFVITKRPINEDSVGEEVWSYERSSKQMGGDRMDFYMDETGVTLVSTGEKESEYFIERLDNQMKSLWKKEMPELLLPEVDMTFQKLKNGTLLMQVVSAPVAEEQFAKGGVTVTNTQLRLVALEPNDELYAISPKVNQAMAVSNSVYTYNNERNEFSGFLFTHQVSTSGKTQLTGQGYAHFSWDVKGEILHSVVKNLTYGDVLKSQDRKVLNKLGISNIPTDTEPLPAFKHPLMASTILDNGDIIVHLQRLETITGSQRLPLGRGGFIMHVKEDGTIGWVTFTPAAEAFINLGACQLAATSNKLHLVYMEFKKNAENPTGIMGATDSDDEDKNAAVMHFDLTTGEYLGTEGLNLNGIEQKHYLSMLYSNYMYEQIPDNLNISNCIYFKCTVFKTKQEVFNTVCFE